MKPLQYLRFLYTRFLRQSSIGIHQMVEKQFANYLWRHPVLQAILVSLLFHMCKRGICQEGMWHRLFRQKYVSRHSMILEQSQAYHQSLNRQ